MWLGVKQSNLSIQTPEEAKIAGLRDCFAEIGDLKFATLLFVCTCLLLARSCNLGRASEHGCWTRAETKRSTAYRRLSRFFATGIGDLLMLGVFRAVLRLALQSGSACCLAVDRTDWQSGATWRNLLGHRTVLSGLPCSLGLDRSRTSGQLRRSGPFGTARSVGCLVAGGRSAAQDLPAGR